MKKSIKVFLIFTLGTIFGVSLLITYASSYNSEEISYDNSNSHAEAENVKDAIDYLYSHGSCGEGMSCLESPTVSIIIDGPGSSDKSSLKVPINGSNSITINPNDGYYLYSISCSDGYYLNEFNTLINSTTDEASKKQNIIISNTRQFDNGICTISFKEGYTTVNLNVSGSGIVSQSSIYVPIDGSSTFTIKPNSGYYLHKITCSSGYSLNTFNNIYNSNNTNSTSEQEITIINNHQTNDGTCTISYGTTSFSVSGGGGATPCSNCICYYIKYGGNNFTYGSHTGCNISNTACTMHGGAESFSCSKLNWNGQCDWYDSGCSVVCSGVISCAT